MNRLLLCVGLVLSVFILGLSQLPWWLLAIPAGVIGFFYKSARKAFLDACLAAFVVWAGVAIIQDGFAGFRTSERLAGIFHLPAGFLAYVVTGLIAGLVAGTAAWFGQSVTYLAVNRPQD